VKRSDQVSSGAVEMPVAESAAASAGASGVPRARVARRSTPCRCASVATAVRTGRSPGIAGGVAVPERGHVGGLGGADKDGGAIVHQGLVGAFARYHSSMVNSTRWRCPPSRFRQTREKVKIRSSPAASSFFIANSGEVWR
jgi:hypothetical protein